MVALCSYVDDTFCGVKMMEMCISFSVLLNTSVSMFKTFFAFTQYFSSKVTETRSCYF